MAAVASCQPSDLRAEIPWVDFSPSQYFLPTCLASEKASWASKEDFGRDRFERDKELNERRISPLQSKPQTPAGVLGGHMSVNSQPCQPGLCEHRGFHYRAAHMVTHGWPRLTAGGWGKGP